MHMYVYVHVYVYEDFWGLGLCLGFVLEASGASGQFFASDSGPCVYSKASGSVLVWAPNPESLQSSARDTTTTGQEPILHILKQRRGALDGGRPKQRIGRARFPTISAWRLMGRSR